MPNGKVLGSDESYTPSKEWEKTHLEREQVFLQKDQVSIACSKIEQARRNLEATTRFLITLGEKNMELGDIKKSLTESIKKSIKIMDEVENIK